MGVKRLVWHPWGLCLVLSVLCAWGGQNGVRFAFAEPTGNMNNHDPGYCAFGGACGVNENGAVPCSSNVPATPISEDMKPFLASLCPQLWEEIKEEGTACCALNDIFTLAASMGVVQGVLGGCPACYNNFVDMWCTVSCSPNQSTFINVTKVAKNEVTGDLAVNEADFFFSEEYKNTLFDSCKNVKYGVTNAKAMDMFKDPKNANEWLQFLGNRSVKAPYQIMFPDKAPDGLTPLNTDIPGCASPGFECSCADCGTASYCQQISPPRPKKSYVKLLVWIILGSALICISTVLGIKMYQITKCRSARARRNESSSDAATPFLEGIHPTPIVFRPIRASNIDSIFGSWFAKQGRYIAKNPIIVILVSAALWAVLAAGLKWLKVETNPQNLWTPKDSRSVREQQAYNDAFGPFFRTETLILSTKKDPKTGDRPSIVTKENIDLLFEMQEVVDKVVGEFKGKDDAMKAVSLSDVCFKPNGNICAIESVLQYWQMSQTKWEKKVKEHNGAAGAAGYCFAHWTTGGSSDVSCMSKFLGPVEPKIVLGGYPSGTDTPEEFVANTTAFIVNYPVNSEKSNLQAALAWEEAFLSTAKNSLKDMAENAGLLLSFYSERSVQDELKRESNADALTVAISYIVMLFYVAAALSWRTCSSPGQVFVNSRVLLALSGVLIVLAAVVGSLGICSLLGVKATLIIMEVIPFLVLAVGVDNMFILTQGLQKQDSSLPLDVRVSQMLSTCGPSICLAAFAEATTFALGIAVPVPAVRTFSFCAFFAIILDFILQITVFVALLALDTARIEANRIECIPCIPLPVGNSDLIQKDEYTNVNEPQQGDQTSKSPLQAFVTQVHIPLLLGETMTANVIRYIVVFGTLAAAFLSGGSIPYLSTGLEQQVALPRDSYLQDFFGDGLDLLRVGPPVMFVVEDMKMSESSTDVNNVCGISGCNPGSLVSKISQAQASGAYHIASPAASWIDDLLMWIKLPSCCNYYVDNLEFCPNGGPPDCAPCNVEVEGKRPTLQQFQKFLPWFMEATPSESCARGGKGVYGISIEHAENATTNITGLEKGMVSASAFRAYYQPLGSQADFIAALKDTRKFVDSTAKELHLQVYAYSIFHVFFESYLRIAILAFGLLLSAIVAGLFICWVFLGSVLASLIVMVCVLFTTIDLIGVMTVWGIQLNGVSVVNLIMGVGIAMEFCVHIVHSFMTNGGRRTERVITSLTGIGSSVISGITFTKLVGVIVLAFSRTQIFEIYFFRMYLSLVLLGVWHGLVFLPVLLSFFGPAPSRDCKPKSNQTEVNSSEIVQLE